MGSMLFTGPEVHRVKFLELGAWLRVHSKCPALMSLFFLLS